MSENLDLVRSIYADWERGDFRSADWAHPEIVFESTAFDAARAKVVAEMAQRWREWMSAWDEYRSEADEFRELDDERVLVLMQHGGRGKASGVGIEGIKTPGSQGVRYTRRQGDEARPLLAPRGRARRPPPQG